MCMTQIGQRVSGPPPVLLVWLTYFCLQGPRLSLVMRHSPTTKQSHSHMSHFVAASAIYLFNLFEALSQCWLGHNERKYLFCASEKQVFGLNPLVELHCFIHRLIFSRDRCYHCFECPLSTLCTYCTYCICKNLIFLNMINYVCCILTWK